VLLAAGAGLYSWIGGAVSHDALVLRGGAFELESWASELQAGGGDLVWKHGVSSVAVSLYKSEGDGQEFDIADPINVTSVKTINIDFRVDNTRTVEQAVVLTIEDQAVKIAVKEGKLDKRGDVWVYPGFVQDGRKKPFEIASLAFVDRNGQVVARYQNPDMGRRFHYRVKLLASAGSQ
jgi:hypothetical protein